MNHTSSFYAFMVVANVLFLFVFDTYFYSFTKMSSRSIKLADPREDPWHIARLKMFNPIEKTLPVMFHSLNKSTTY